VLAQAVPDSPGTARPAGIPADAGRRFRLSTTPSCTDRAGNSVDIARAAVSLHCASADSIHGPRSTRSSPSTDRPGTCSKRLRVTPAAQSSSTKAVLRKPVPPRCMSLVGMFPPRCFPSARRRTPLPFNRGASQQTVSTVLLSIVSTQAQIQRPRAAEARWKDPSWCAPGLCRTCFPVSSSWYVGLLLIELYVGRPSPPTFAFMLSMSFELRCVANLSHGKSRAPDSGGLSILPGHGRAPKRHHL